MTVMVIPVAVFTVIVTIVGMPLSYGNGNPLDSVGTKAKSPNAARIGQRNVVIKLTFCNAHLYQRCGSTCSSC
jgi:hypothetical protein